MNEIIDRIVRNMSDVELLAYHKIGGVVPLGMRGRLDEMLDACRPERYSRLPDRPRRGAVTFRASGVQRRERQAAA